MNSLRNISKSFVRQLNYCPLSFSITKMTAVNGGFRFGSTRAGRMSNSDKSSQNSSLSSESSSNDLKVALEAEIKYEKLNNPVTGELPAPLAQYLRESNWTLSEKEGDAVTTLTCQKNGMKLNVLFDCRQIYSDFGEYDEEADEDEDEVSTSREDVDEDDEKSPIAARIELINNANEKLTFDVNFTPTYVNVNAFYCSPANVSPVENADASLVPSSSSPFYGPNYMDLSEDLQEAVEEYLTTNGVDFKMYSFIGSYLDLKEKKEYFSWLSKSRTFFGQ